MVGLKSHSIALYKEQLGEDHHYVARGYNSLGNALMAQHRTEAETLG